MRQVEQASFVPAVMSASGGMGPASTALYKRIAHLLAEKRGEHYSHVMAFVRCRIFLQPSEILYRVHSRL